MRKFFLSRSALFVCCFIILGIFVFGIIRNVHSDAPVRFLPFYGTTKYDTVKNGSSIRVDTDYYHVPAFHFRAQDGSEMTEKNFAGSIYVAEYFVTSGSVICRAMNKNMEKVFEHFKGNKEIKFASFTSDPANDSVPVIRSYVEKYGAGTKQWIFLTGDKSDLFDLARYGYLMNAGRNQDDLVQTSQFVLVDKQGHIRGYYDGTRDREIGKLVVEMNILQQTYAYYKNHSIQAPF